MKIGRLANGSKMKKNKPTAYSNASISDIVLLPCPQKWPGPFNSYAAWEMRRFASLMTIEIGGRKASAGH
jgi:hypothetical protein